MNTTIKASAIIQPVSRTVFKQEDFQNFQSFLEVAIREHFKMPCCVDVTVQVEHKYRDLPSPVTLVLERKNP